MEENSHGITISARSHAEITGVCDVGCFNEELVVLTTTMGTLTICGSKLNISRLSREDGRVTIDGEFDSVEYSGNNRDGKGGFWGRLLR